MSSDGLFLDAAAAIGRSIVADAVWHNGYCSWMGAVTRPSESTAQYHALGPSLYGGTAGVGLFLAQIANATGDRSFRRTAVGALRHAAALARQSPVSRRDGFHAGSVGVAWAAARAAPLLEEDELHARAVEVSTQLDVPSGPDRCPDLITGMAGSALGLLALADELGDPRLVEEARAKGEILISRATVTSHGWSWAIPARRYPAHLCGISHGAAGIGWALLELFAATGDARFRAAAMGAFAYERSWLDPVTGRWPDLRIRGQRRGPLAPIDSGIAGTWCYGEAGIALTRLRAVAVLGPGPHSGDAEIAVETTRRHLADALPYAIDELSLCHGLGGAADVLLDAAAACSERWHQVAEVVTELGRVMLERYADADQQWACGTEGETTPGLFLGLSGIGWLFLRLHDPATPTPLAPIRP
jgi:lantibiotic modifying enzyme